MLPIVIGKRAGFYSNLHIQRTNYTFKSILFVSLFREVHDEINWNGLFRKICCFSRLS